MEFASEHVIRGAKLGLDIREIEIDYHQRSGESKLSSFSDGWRHLRFLLVHSPTWLFFLPGTVLAILGALGTLIAASGIELFGREWQLHALIASVAAVIVGAQLLQIGVFSRAFAFYYLGERDPVIERLRGRSSGSSTASARAPCWSAARARDRRHRARPLCAAAASASCARSAPPWPA